MKSTNIPVNKQAALITSQKGCTDTFLLNDRESLNAVCNKLQLQSDELKNKLGIKTRQQYKNYKYYAKHPVHKGSGNKIKVQRYSKTTNDDFFKLIQINQRINDIRNRIALL